MPPANVPLRVFATNLFARRLNRVIRIIIARFYLELPRTESWVKFKGRLVLRVNAYTFPDKYLSIVTRCL